jgi:tetratricopeptide (TPR) repeat protein
LFESYIDYSRDISLAKYSADAVGQYINQASREQVQAINHLGQAIGRGMNVLSNQMSDINTTLEFLNRNMDIQIEQQKLSNLLLQNIAELLRVPDSEKERQQSIVLGIKFFVNAKKDSDLYADALEELLKAESLMKQDYFVLHRIGCIYLYAEKYISPEKAIDYFLRAAKYASVESDPSSMRLVNALTQNFNTANSESNNSEKQIGLLAADSYEKGAFASYVIGRFEDSVNYQSKALRFNPTSENRFNLSKYQVRNNNIKEAIDNLDKSINESPYLAIAVFKELDLVNEPEVIKLIAQKNEAIDNKIKELSEKWKTIESTKASEVIIELSELIRKSYEIKIADFNKYENEWNTINTDINELEAKIDAYINEVKQTTYCTFDDDKIQTTINELQLAKNLPLEKMQVAFDNFIKKLEADKLKIGSKYAGGIVFYLDKTGEHGLVCAEKDSGEAIWGTKTEEDFGQRWEIMAVKKLFFSTELRIHPSSVLIGAAGSGIADGSGIENTKKIVELASWYIEKGWLSPTKTVAPTAARMCLELNHNNYNDWYLPTHAELNLIRENKEKIGGFAFGTYWSSTEYDDIAAIGWQNFRKDRQGPINTLSTGYNAHRFVWYGSDHSSPCSKSIKCKVRAVRAF